MKLRNKKTGGLATLVENEDCLTLKTDAGFHHYFSLAQLNEEWEDYEEQKEYWCIDWTGGVNHITLLDDSTDKYEKDKMQIGNYFETEEEAERAVEKLKAWKRLKDKKFEFTEWYKPDGCEPFIVIETNIDYDDVDNKELQKDLDLLFGGEDGQE